MFIEPNSYRYILISSSCYIRSFFVVSRLGDYHNGEPRAANYILSEYQTSRKTGI